MLYVYLVRKLATVYLRMYVHTPIAFRVLVSLLTEACNFMDVVTSYQLL